MSKTVREQNTIRATGSIRAPRVRTRKRDHVGQHIQPICGEKSRQAPHMANLVLQSNVVYSRGDQLSFCNNESSWKNKSVSCGWGPVILDEPRAGLAHSYPRSAEVLSQPLIVFQQPPELEFCHRLLWSTRAHVCQCESGCSGQPAGDKLARNIKLMRDGREKEVRETSREWGGWVNERGLKEERKHSPALRSSLYVRPPPCPK